MEKTKKLKRFSMIIVFVLLIFMLSITAYAALTMRLMIIISAQNQKTVGLTTVKDDLGMNWSIEFTDGTGANQADIIWHDSRTLAIDANDVLDFHAGNLKDAFGTALTLDIVKLIAIKNNSSVASLKIGGSTTSQIGIFDHISDILVLPPGGKFIFSAPDEDGLDVITSSRLHLKNGSGIENLVYQIIVVGVD